MTVERPDAADLAPIAERYGLELTGADLAEIVPMVSSMLGAYDRVAELYAERRPARRPAGTGNGPRTTNDRGYPGPRGRRDDQR